MDDRLLHSDLSRKVLACAFEVHARLGPGLLENIYAACLARELRFRGLQFRTEVPISVKYRDVTLENAYRADFIVAERLLHELKA